MGTIKEQNFVQNVWVPLNCTIPRCCVIIRKQILSKSCGGDIVPEEKKPYIIDGQRVTLEEYRKTKYEDLRVRVPKGMKEEIKKFVASTGKSLNAFINEAIDEKIEREKQ